jgi:hypothetical protein
MTWIIKCKKTEGGTDVVPPFGNVPICLLIP